MGLFFLARKISRLKPNFDIRLINPGMVATKIFGDYKDTSLIGTAIRGIREWLSLPPKEAAEIMGRWISMRGEQLNTSNQINIGFTYFTPYESNRLFGFIYKTEMLQDLFGYRLLYRNNCMTSNFSELVMDPDVEAAYTIYMQHK